MIKLGYIKLPKSEKIIPFIEELKFKNAIYPEIEIKQFDICPAMKETVEVWCNFCFELEKKDFLKLLEVGSSEPKWHLPKEHFECEVTIKTKPSKEVIKYREEIDEL